MTEQQLVYVVTIVNFGSYSEAALELNISQSSISKQVLALEDELGVQLFDRSARRISLTPAGETLLPEIRKIVQLSQGLRRSAEKLQPSYMKRISILSLPVAGPVQLHIPIRRFEEEHKDYQVELLEREEQALSRQLLKGDFDLAFTYYDPYYVSRHSSEQSVFIPVLDDEIVAAVNESHPLAAKNKIQPCTLNEIPMMRPSVRSCIDNLLQNYFDEHHVMPKVIYRGGISSLLGGAEAGGCVSIVTRCQANYYRTRNLKLVSFDPPLKASLGLFMNTEQHHRYGSEMRDFILQDLADTSFCAK